MNFILYKTFDSDNVKTLSLQKNNKRLFSAFIDTEYIVLAVYVDGKKVLITHSNLMQVAVLNDNNFDLSNLDHNHYNASSDFVCDILDPVPLSIAPFQSNTEFHSYSTLPLYGSVRPEIILLDGSQPYNETFFYENAPFLQDNSVKDLSITYKSDGTITSQVDYRHLVNGDRGIYSVFNTQDTKPQTWQTQDVINNIDDIFFTCQYISNNAKNEDFTISIRVYPRYNFVFVFPTQNNPKTWKLGQTNFNNRYAVPQPDIDFELNHINDPTKFFRFFLSWKQIPVVPAPNYLE